MSSFTATHEPELPLVRSPPRRDRVIASLRQFDRGLAERSEAELIAQVLSGDDPTAEVVRCAAQLASIPFWRRRLIGAAGLSEHHGVSRSRAVRLAALWELAERWYPDDRPSISSPRDALLVFEELRHAHTERVMVLMLDARHRPLGTELVALGTINASRLAPRDVLAPALRGCAAGLIVAHNHPSGDPLPSRADRHVTNALRQAASLVGVPLLDHLIVARSGYHSFREAEGWNDASNA